MLLFRVMLLTVSKNRIFQDLSLKMSLIASSDSTEYYIQAVLRNRSCEGTILEATDENRVFFSVAATKNIGYEAETLLDIQSN